MSNIDPAKASRGIYEDAIISSGLGSKADKVGAPDMNDDEEPSELPRDKEAEKEADEYLSRYFDEYCNISPNDKDS